jgi:hypothetical protein
MKKSFQKLSEVFLSFIRCMLRPIFTFFNCRPIYVIKNVNEFQKGKILTSEFFIDLPETINLVELSEELYPIDYTKEKILANCSKYYLAQIRNCRYFAHRGLDILSKENSLLPFLTINEDYMNLSPNYLDEILSFTKYPKSKKINGTSLFLTTSGADSTYGEWVVHLMPKVSYMKSLGYEFTDFNFIVINEIKYPWQKDFLEILQIPKEKIIETNPNKSFLFEELFIPFGSGHSLKGFDFLRSIAEKVSPSTQIIPAKRYFLSRKKDKWMKVLNENDILPILKKFHIEVLFLQDYSIKEQIQFFQESELIISPQGSGLTNIVFSNPETKFIELYARTNLNSTFQCYGYLNGNKFGALICDDEPSGYGDKNNIIVDIERLELLIKKMLVTE